MREAHTRVPDDRALPAGGALSAGQLFDEFDAGDPRRGPHSAEEIAEAVLLCDVPARWHFRKPGVDWLAICLQHGRGRARREIARMFGIGVSTLDRRRNAEAWPAPMSEADRRRLSRLVWLGGLARNPGDCPESRAALRACSDYTLLQKKAPPVFQLLHPEGAPIRFTLNHDILE